MTEPKHRQHNNHESNPSSSSSSSHHHGHKHHRHKHHHHHNREGSLSSSTNLNHHSKKRSHGTRRTTSQSNGNSPRQQHQHNRHGGSGGAEEEHQHQHHQHRTKSATAAAAAAYVTLQHGVQDHTFNAIEHQFKDLDHKQRKLNIIFNKTAASINDQQKAFEPESIFAEALSPSTGLNKDSKSGNNSPLATPKGNSLLANSALNLRALVSSPKIELLQPGNLVKRSERHRFWEYLQSDVDDLVFRQTKLDFQPDPFFIELQRKAAQTNKHTQSTSRTTSSSKPIAAASSMNAKNRLKTEFRLYSTVPETIPLSGALNYISDIKTKRSQKDKQELERLRQQEQKAIELHAETPLGALNRCTSSQSLFSLPSTSPVIQKKISGSKLSPFGAQEGFAGKSQKTKREPFIAKLLNLDKHSRNRITNDVMQRSIDMQDEAMELDDASVVADEEAIAFKPTSDTNQVNNKQQSLNTGNEADMPTILISKVPSPRQKQPRAEPQVEFLGLKESTGELHNLVADMNQELFHLIVRLYSCCCLNLLLQHLLLI